MTGYIPTPHGLDVIHEVMFPGREMQPSTWPLLEQASITSEYAGPLLPDHILASDDECARFNAGLAACKEAGVAPRSREGLHLRWRAFTGESDIPKAWERWLEKVEAARAAEDDEKAKREAHRAAVRGYLEGWEELPEGAYTGTIYSGSLPIVAGDRNYGVLEIDEHTRVLHAFGGGSMHYETVWRDDVTDAERKEWAQRQRIVGYRYHPDLARALADIQRWSPAGWMWTRWLGRSYETLEGRGFVDGCSERADNHTGPERGARLAEYLSAEWPAEADELVARAREELAKHPIEAVTVRSRKGVLDDLAEVHAAIQAARDEEAALLEQRSHLTRAAIATSITKYQIAQRLGVSQHAVTLMAQRASQFEAGIKRSAARGARTEERNTP